MDGQEVLTCEQLELMGGLVGPLRSIELPDGERGLGHRFLLGFMWGAASASDNYAPFASPVLDESLLKRARLFPVTDLAGAFRTVEHVGGQMGRGVTAMAKMLIRVDAELSNELCSAFPQ